MRTRTLSALSEAAPPGPRTPMLARSGVGTGVRWLCPVTVGPVQVDTASPSIGQIGRHPAALRPSATSVPWLYGFGRAFTDEVVRVALADPLVGAEVRRRGAARTHVGSSGPWIVNEKRQRDPGHFRGHSCPLLHW